MSQSDSMASLEATDKLAFNAPVGLCAALEAKIAELRALGAPRFDPVRFHYIEALARRSALHRGKARQLLDIKLANAIAAFEERFDRARSSAEETAAKSMHRHPDKAAELRQFLAAGDFRKVHRLAATLQTSAPGSSLSALVGELEQHAVDSKNSHVRVNKVSQVELKAIRNFRKTWAKLSVEREVTQALEQAPKNAGPINSHMLVLRLLATLRDISPDYLSHFMSYADTLLTLERDGAEKPAEPKKRRVVKAKKNKS